MDNKKKFVVTGATGFIGSQLVPRLSELGELLLVSRDPDTAAQQFQNVRICGYDDLSQADIEGAVFVHLAVRNNDQPGTLKEFRETNVTFLMETAEIAKEGGAAQFINLCSTYALEPDAKDLYGLSKQEGAAKLRVFWPDGAINLYVPAVYGERFSGRLSFLDRFSDKSRPPVLALLRLIKPTLSIGCLGDTLEVISDNSAFRKADGGISELYLADPVPKYGLYAASKRAIDLFAAVAVIILLGWAMLLIALYIRIDSKGPAIFAQKRVGQHAKIFTCFKFRTMATGTADAATHDVSVQSVTKAGRFLRRTKLDEIPQVVNILRNEMSLVGPRPCLPLQQELIERRAARGVLSLKPGITGLAQINDVDMSDPARLATMDDRYRAFRTVAGDALILLKTALGGGTGDRISQHK